MSNVGGTSGAARPDFGFADAGEVKEAADKLAAKTGGANSMFDSSKPTQTLANRLLQDGKFDVADAKALIKDAKDVFGITAAERQVFVGLLRQHGAKVTPAALDILAGHFGLQIQRPGTTTPTTPTTPVNPGTITASGGGINILGDQKNGIAGTAKPGDTIEAINLSTAPAGRLHLDNTVQIARADASGKFSGNLPDVKEGDVIRMRRRGADGTPGEWLTVRATGLGTDTRAAEVNLERIDLVAGADGTIDAIHNTPRPITEPGARLRFTNVRTGEKFDTVATDAGSLPAGFKLKGKAGDEFTVAGSDGRNNATLSTITGKLKVPDGAGGAGGVDLPDPGALASDLRPDGTPKFGKVRFSGPLFKEGARPQDVRQGAIGDCYFPAAFAAMAAAKPSSIEDMIKKNADGTYTVRFYEGGQKSRPVDVKVDGDLYARSFGGPVYGSSLGGSTAPGEMEMWFPLVEKAYAQWKGGYEKIGHGGNSGRVMSETLGAPNDYESLSPRSDSNRIFETIKKAAAKNQPMTAGTHGKDDSTRYTNTGVYADHAYSVLGVEEDGGKKYVKLRNPWGQSEAGFDGKNDGFFRLEMSKFLELYQSLSVLEV